MHFFFDSQSFLQALLVCVCTWFFVFKKDMDVDTKHNTGVGEG